MRRSARFTEGRGGDQGQWGGQGCPYMVGHNPTMDEADNHGMTASRGHRGVTRACLQALWTWPIYNEEKRGSQGWPRRARVSQLTRALSASGGRAARGKQRERVEGDSDVPCPRHRAKSAGERGSLRWSGYLE